MDASETVDDPKGWPEHVVRAGSHNPAIEGDPLPSDHRDHVEPWLSALFQAEHLNLLVGSGFTAAIAHAAGASVADMGTGDFTGELSDAVNSSAAESAEQMGRGDPNFEDQVRAALELIRGLEVLAKDAGESGELVKESTKYLAQWQHELEQRLSRFVEAVLATERGVATAFTDEADVHRANNLRRLVGGFLLPFASRTGTRDRLHIFTTNYDRLIEYGCDLLGLRLLDRFVGNLAPVFHSSRLGIDLHYNPPGIRGEPRYLEGVARFTKLHGSLDWRHVLGPSGGFEVQRCSLPFGAPHDHPELCNTPKDRVLVYPNAAKDVETTNYPYAEFFRDFAASICRPNAVLVTYGYGFGDDHIYRVLGDMLTIPSTHLVIISYDPAEGRVERFCERIGRDEQISLLVGNHFGDLGTLLEHYLPKPAIDRTTWRMMDLLSRRARPISGEQGRGNEAVDNEELV